MEANMSEAHSESYRSNPFRVLMNQFSILLKQNPISTLTLGLFMALLLFLGFLGLLLIGALFNSTAATVVTVIAGIIYVVLVLFRFSAASAYLHIASREGRSLTARQAVTEVAKKNYNNFVLTSIAANVILILGFLAFVIPGIFLLGRLSFAPYIALNEGLGVADSLKRSWALTAGHWFETFGAMIAAAIAIPSGLLAFVGGQSGLAGRYFELSDLKKSGAKAPETHWMNYLLSVLAIVGILLYAVLMRNAKDTNSSLTDYCKDNKSSFLCSDSLNDYNTQPSSRDFDSLDDYEDLYNSTPAN